MSQTAKHRKRIYLINRDFQLRYSYTAACVGIVSTLVTAIVLLYPLYVFEILRIPRFLPWPILGIMVVAAIINISLIGFMGIFITHKIAGPMYSLVRSFRKIEMGRWAGHLTVRDGDELKYVIRNFNQLIDGLVEIGRQDVSIIDEVLSKLSSDEPTSRQDGISQLQNLRLRVAERLEEGRVEGQQQPETGDLS